MFNQKVGKIEEHFRNIAAEDTTLTETIKQRVTKKAVMKSLVIVTILYNMVFIPLQFAFSISFEWPFWFFEAITLVVFAVDIYLRKNNLDELILTNRTMYASSNLIHRILAEDREEYERRKRNVRFELVCSLIAFFPFSLVFSLAGVST
jgi:hypothetical protein